MNNETQAPQCVGIIMDGNRRWAKNKGLPAFEGHRRGYETLKEIVKCADEAKVGTLMVFAFSEENWKRAAEEVSFILSLIREFILDQAREVIAKNVCLRFVGNIAQFPEDIAKGMRDLESESDKNTGITLAFCVSYGGRKEILHATKELIREGNADTPDEDFQKKFEEKLYTTGLPDPDIIIRTSGEMRLSGFLPWQTVYSELFFTRTFWPDFKKEEFLEILKEYAQRERRLGK